MSVARAVQTALQTPASARQNLRIASALANELEARLPALVQTATQEGGFPVKVTRREVTHGINNLRNLEQEIDRLPASFASWGKTAAIVAYDASAVVFSRLAGAAILTNTPVSFGFSSHIPRTADLIQSACVAATPSLRVSENRNNKEFAQGALDDPEVRYFFFSGAKALGESYKHQREQFDKLVFGGPGGLPPAIVMPDAPLDVAINYIAHRSFVNGGQYCMCVKRVLIHKSVYDQVLNGVLDQVKTIVVGDPSDERTDIGPVTVSRTRTGFVDAIQKDLRSARQIIGKVDGEMLYPHVLEMPYDQVPDISPFGPLLIASPFDDAADMVQSLTKSEFGLTAAVFGSLPQPQMEILRANYGAVWHNTKLHLLSPNHTALGGRKTSGWSQQRTSQGWTERSGPYLHSQAMAKTE
eukprot:GILJ01004225.1.p1 GENE.GILJ01004225.1~~GILJ01004225.1.p1  ORF type:complete len:435 (+),score=60.45 GILJ01004225.1:68-1306(+)